jgi:hypothetical protein
LQPACWGADDQHQLGDGKTVDEPGWTWPALGN